MQVPGDLREGLIPPPITNFNCIYNLFGLHFVLKDFPLSVVNWIGWHTEDISGVLTIIFPHRCHCYMGIILLSKGQKYLTKLTAMYSFLWQEFSPSHFGALRFCTCNQDMKKWILHIQGNLRHQMPILHIWHIKIVLVKKCSISCIINFDKFSQKVGYYVLC